MKIHALLLLLLSLFLFAAALGAPSLWDESEAKYAQVANEMVQSGDWLTPTWSGEHYFVHPPLSYWLTGGAIQWFGKTEWSVRLFPMLFGIGCVWLTVLIGQALFSSQVGWLSGFIFATTLHNIVIARLGIMDSLLNFFTLLAIFFLIRGNESRAPRYFLGAWIAMALATLAKGPIGLILPLLIFLPFCLLSKNMAALRSLFRFKYMGAFLLITLPWYLIATATHGMAFLQVMFEDYTFGRYLGVVENQSGPLYYYLPATLLGLFPWSSFLPFSFIPLLRAMREHTPSRFILLWMVLGFLFFSLAGTKQVNYTVSLYPAYAIAIGVLWDQALKGVRRTMLWISLGSLLLFLIIGLMQIGIHLFCTQNFPKEYLQNLPLLYPLAFFSLGGSLAANLFLLRHTTRWLSFAALVILMTTCFGYLNLKLFPAIEPYKPSPVVAQTLQQQLSPGDQVVAYRLRARPSLLFYIDHPITWINTPEALSETATQANIKKTGLFLIISTSDWEQLNPQPSLRVQSRAHDLSLLISRPTP